ncbi:hypothetical protein ABIC44_000636 [Sphingomonas sp. 1185]
MPKPIRSSQRLERAGFAQIRDQVLFVTHDLTFRFWMIAYPQADMNLFAGFISDRDSNRILRGQSYPGHWWSKSLDEQCPKLISGIQPRRPYSREGSLG